MSKEKYRARQHCLLLYPDNEQHQEAIKKIENSYDYAMITHNRDYWTEVDEKNNPLHTQGELKKEHCHIVLRFPQPVWSTAICKDLGIDTNYIEAAKRFDNALLYLIHYNDTDKAQYTIDEVKGSLKKRLQEIINKNDKSEGEKVSELIEYITTRDRKMSITEFSCYCAMNGYWSEFRRSASIFIKIIEEHNSNL